MAIFDGSFLPYEKATHDEPRVLVQERLEGKQVAWLHEMSDEPGPSGSPVLGFELTTGERCLVMAVLDRSTTKWRSRLVFVWLPAEKIVTPKMTTHFRMGRDAFRSVEEAPTLAKQIEGEVVRGVHLMDAPTAWAGEQTEIEFASGARLWLASDHQARAPYTADLGPDFRRPARTIFGANGRPVA